MTYIRLCKYVIAGHSVVQEIGVGHIVQVITYNNANFEKAGELLQQEQLALFWTPYVIYYINLTKLLYNYQGLQMRKFVNREIL